MRTRKSSVKLSLEEIDDERIYAEHRCNICLKVVATWDATSWMVSDGLYVIFCPTCANRAAAAIGSRPLREILPLLRAMRPEVEP